MSTLQNRLEEVMKHMSWDHADLVAVSGQSHSVVSQWLGKGSKVIKSIGKMEAAERIEVKSGYSSLWVAKGIGPKMRPKAEGLTLRIPPTIIAWEDLMSEALPHRFQTRIPDDAVAPLVPAGSMVTFDTTITSPRPGDGILVKDSAGYFHFRRFRQGSPQRWEAYSSNDAYRLLDSERDGLTLVGVFVGSEHRLG